MKFAGRFGTALLLYFTAGLFLYMGFNAVAHDLHLHMHLGILAGGAVAWALATIAGALRWGWELFGPPDKP